MSSTVLALGSTVPTALLSFLAARQVIGQTDCHLEMIAVALDASTCVGFASRCFK